MYTKKTDAAIQVGIIMRRTFRWDKKYLYWGMTAFLVITACVLLAFVMGNILIVRDFFAKLIRIFSPFIWGLAFTYFLGPLASLVEQRFFVPFCRKVSEKKNAVLKKNRPVAPEKLNRVARVLSVLFAEIVLLLVILALVALIIPQLYTSVETVVINSKTYLDTATAWLGEVLENNTWLSEQIQEYILEVTGGLSDSMFTWLRNTFLPGLSTLVTSVSSGVYQTGKAIYNLVIGMIVSVYLLGDKEHFKANSVRLLYAIFSIQQAERIRKSLLFADKTFRDFFAGKLLDSAIIGVICYVGCIFMQMPYALLVSVIIGVTNIIPFFGPIIGLVPTALLILFVSPVKCLMFVIFILILQQVDGNFIGPKILGSSMGISGFWVMFSILVGAGFFGFWGMLLGVPVFAVLFEGMKQVVNRKLARSDLPVEGKDYIDLQRIDPVTMQPIYKNDSQVESTRLIKEENKK